jgi:hypothetical protein
MQLLSASKTTLQLCHQKHHHVLFLVVRCMLVILVWFIACGPFFFFSLSSLEDYSLTLFVVGISTLVLILLIFNFYSWPFYRSFICFQFHSSISIYHIFFLFSFWLSFFWLFYLGFILNDFSFQFYHSIKNKIYFVF